MTAPEVTLLDLIAHARHTDKPTSHAAAATVKVSRHRQIVLDLLAEVGPATNERLEDIAAARRLPITGQSLRSRRKELTDAGLVRDTGRTDVTRCGRQATVWELVAA